MCIGFKMDNILIPVMMGEERLKMILNGIVFHIPKWINIKVITICVSSHNKTELNLIYIRASLVNKWSLGGGGIESKLFGKPNAIVLPSLAYKNFILPLQ